MEPNLPTPSADQPVPPATMATAATQIVPPAPPVRTINESNVVRSIYLYAMCAVSVALLLFGLITAATSAVRLAAPDAGQRDALDRVGTGLANIADKVVNLVDPHPTLAKFCAEDQAGLGTNTVTAECKRAYDRMDFGSISTQVTQVTDALRGEVDAQIRWTAFGHLMIGLFVSVAGLILLRIHRPKVAAYNA